MKVEMLTSIVSAIWSYAIGEVVDLPDDQAKTWIKSKIAAPIETAMVTPPETRTRKVKR